MQDKDKKIWKHVIIKHKSLYGETDFQKKTIGVNKAFHKSKGNHRGDIKKNKDGSASLIDSMIHEEIHAKHPKMLEKTVRKVTPRKVKKMSKKEKQKEYNKFK